MRLPVTSLLALPLTALMIGLALRVAALRLHHRIGIGVAGNKSLARAMAAHGNAVENIPLGLLLLALAEWQGANQPLLVLGGLVFIVARLMNAWGVSRYNGNSFTRFYGILGSWLVLGLLALLNAWLGLQQP